MKARTILAIVVLMLSASSEAAAQRFGGMDQRDVTGSAYHVFVESGERSIQVLVLGAARSPGIYEIGDTVPMDHLLALAGGTSSTPETSKEKRSVRVRLLRGDGANRTILYEAELQQMLSEPGLYPALQDGDVLALDATVRQKFNWSEALRIVSTAASLYLVADRLTRSLK